MLNAYRKRENLEKADFYLLQGIYDYDPEAKDFKYLYQINDFNFLQAETKTPH